MKPMRKKMQLHVSFVTYESSSYGTLSGISSYFFLFSFLVHSAVSKQRRDKHMHNGRGERERSGMCNCGWLAKVKPHNDCRHTCIASSYALRLDFVPLPVDRFSLLQQLFFLALSLHLQLNVQPLCQFTWAALAASAAFYCFWSNRKRRKVSNRLSVFLFAIFCFFSCDKLFKIKVFLFTSFHFDANEFECRRRFTPF